MYLEQQRHVRQRQEAVQCVPVRMPHGLAVHDPGRCVGEAEREAEPHVPAIVKLDVPEWRPHTNVISCANMPRPHKCHQLRQHVAPTSADTRPPVPRYPRLQEPESPTPQAGRQAGHPPPRHYATRSHMSAEALPPRQAGRLPSFPTNVQHVAQVHSYCRQHEANGSRRRRPVPGPECPSQHADEAERNHGVGAAVVQPLSKARVPARERGRSVDDIYQSASVQTSEGQTHTCTDSSQGPKIGSTFRI